MALVEITSGSLHAGANLRKLEVGEIVEVDDATAKRWVDTGKAKETDKKKGAKLTSFEVATPSSGDASALQAKLDDANAQIKSLQDAAESKEKEHAAALEAETKRADNAEAALAAATKKDK
ncbi:hypothetical protein HA41_00655 [Pantoea conspicua]|uniref:Uncharacterized protein n=1 Tax=Pantoea conspicua TaxID=472705 RepID=A0A1X1C2R7_9GAMM|nr:hypothetical protein [Pantoea conspicua]ORM55975.1 hypothetical protein HA41_00655 [Pantoea conspicua]